MGFAGDTDAFGRVNQSSAKQSGIERILNRIFGDLLVVSNVPSSCVIAGEATRLPIKWRQDVKPGTCGIVRPQVWQSERPPSRRGSTLRSE